MRKEIVGRFKRLDNITEDYKEKGLSAWALSNKYNVNISVVKRAIAGEYVPILDKIKCFDFLPIVGHDDGYYINKYGQVLTLKGFVPAIMRPVIGTGGYFLVKLRNNGAGRMLRVHRLLAPEYISIT
jgi:hypothetical protein